MKVFIILMKVMIESEKVFDLLLEYLDLLNKKFTYIHKLDFYHFFNNFNEKRILKNF